MIVSHRHRFVFLKTQKTASTSIEVFLRRFCGPQDIVTPITPVDEKVAVDAGMPPRNFAFDPALEKAYIEHVAHGEMEAAFALHREPMPFQNHMRAATLRERLGAGVFDDYFVFTIERHPYDRAISRAGFELGFADYREGKGAPADAERVITLLRSRIADGSLSAYANWPIYTIDDKVVADAVIFYEMMKSGLEKVLKRLGLGAGIDLAEAMPHLKGGLRPRRMTRDMLPEDCRAALREVCAREFETFGYRP